MPRDGDPDPTQGSGMMSVKALSANPNLKLFREYRIGRRFLPGKNGAIEVCGEKGNDSCRVNGRKTWLLGAPELAPSSAPFLGPFVLYGAIPAIFLCIFIVGEAVRHGRGQVPSGFVA